MTEITITSETPDAIYTYRYSYDTGLKHLHTEVKKMIRIELVGETMADINKAAKDVLRHFDGAADPPQAVPQNSVELPTVPMMEAPKATTDTYRLEEIRAKGLAAARTHGQPAVKALLEEFGAANMTNLAPEQYAAFVERLEGLGNA